MTHAKRTQTTPHDDGPDAPIKRPCGSMVAAALLAFVLPLVIASAGCGTTRGYSATEQLVMSEAVDSSVSRLDFRPLTGQKVYLDTTYLKNVKGEQFVNCDYVTSAIRQQIVAAGCLMQDAAADADVIIEARIGALGTDDHRVTFGLPENNAVSAAIALIPGSPSVGSVPEIALARRESREAAAKVFAFAYDRHSRAPLWQSGVEKAAATAKDTWVMGVGPFQGGSIRGDKKLAKGNQVGGRSVTGSPARFFDRPPVDYTAEVRYEQGWPVLDHGGLSPDMIGIPAAGTQREAIVTDTPAEKSPTVAELPSVESEPQAPEKLQR